MDKRQELLKLESKRDVLWMLVKRQKPLLEEIYRNGFDTTKAEHLKLAAILAAFNLAEIYLKDLEFELDFGNQTE